MLKLIKFSPFLWILISILFSNQISAQMSHKLSKIQLGSYEFDVRISGDAKGEPVILLHGWPESSHLWIPLMDSLSAKGYYCIASDMRGFSSGARPKGKKNYSVQHITRDVIMLADSFGFKKFHLIGHDWGAAVGWAVAALHPERLQSWTAMSVPHIKAFGEAINKDKDQHKRTAYMRLFQLSMLPESYLKAKKMKRMKERLWNLSDPEQLAVYVELFGAKGALTATLNYYRANYKPMVKGFKNFPEINSINVPTLMIWGKDDEAINRVGVDGTAAYVKKEYKLVVLDAGHWLVQEAFKEVEEAVLAQLKAYKLDMD